METRYKPPYLGVAYYPEDWPDEELQRDIEKMKDAGINVARIGEFAWSKMEAEEGKFTFDWLHRVIDSLADAGIATILGTPTATPPIWLSRRAPDVLFESENGRRRQHGGRRHCCSNNNEYRAASARIVEAMAKEFGNDENIIGWQIDNEIYAHGKGCFCPVCHGKFSEYLKERFIDIASLNKAWNLGIFSQEYTDFCEIPTPRDAWVNPHHNLAWLEFQQASHIEFVEMQLDILKKYVTVPIGTDAMPLNGLCHSKLTKRLDVAQFNHYNHTDNLWEACFWLDLIRPLKDRPFWNTETSTCYAASEAIRRTTTPEGFCYANSFLPIVLGGEANLYWLWRTHWGGHELMHGAVLYPSGRPMYPFSEIQKLSADLKVASDFINNTKVVTKTALHFPAEAWNFFETQKIFESFEYKRRVMDGFYKPMIDMAIRPDVLESDAPIDKYSLIFTPYVPSLEWERLGDRLTEWVRQGGTWVVGPMTDIRNSDGAHFKDRPLGMLEEFADLYLAHSLPCTDGAFVCETADGRRLDDSPWYELYRNEGDSLASVTGAPHSELLGHSVLLCRKVGKGTVIILGFLPSAKDMKELILPLACDIAKIPYGAAEGDSLIIAERKGDASEGIMIAEIAGRGGSYALPYPMRDVITTKTFDDRATLAPYEVLLLEKQ